jgi:hypothetical protein
LQDEGKIETPEYCKRKIEEYQEKFDKLTILFPYHEATERSDSRPLHAVTSG